MNMETQTDKAPASGDAPADATDSTVQINQPPFFIYPELTQCLHLINHLVENTQLIPLIKGQEGSGKTTLLSQLQSQSPQHWLCCRINANPMMHPDQLYSQLAQYFHLNEQDDPIEQALLIHFESLQHNGTLPIIAIDDAHLLPIDTVAELLKLQSSSTPEHSHLLHIILFATPAIDNLLKTEGNHTLHTPIIQTLNIPPLSPEQTTAYITQILITWGTGKTSLLTTDQIERIAHASRGLPGRIECLLAKQPVHHKTTTQKQRKNPIFTGLPITLIIGSVGLTSIILALLLFQDDINRLFDSTPSHDFYTENPVAEDASEVGLTSPAKKTAAETASIPPAEILEHILETPEKKAVITTSTNEPKTQSKISIHEVSALENDQADIPLAKVSEPPKPSATEKSITPPAIREPISANELIPDISERLPIKAKTVAKSKIVQPTLKQETWLLSQKPTAYTLQIIGLKDRAGLFDYIKQHELTGEAAYFKTSRNSHPWYPLLYGVYPNRAMAIAARSKLSVQLNQKDIWVRNLAAIHKEIKATR